MLNWQLSLSTVSCICPIFLRGESENYGHVLQATWSSTPKTPFCQTLHGPHPLWRATACLPSSRAWTQTLPTSSRFRLATKRGLVQPQVQSLLLYLMVSEACCYWGYGIPLLPAVTVLFHVTLTMSFMERVWNNISVFIYILENEIITNWKADCLEEEVEVEDEEEGGGGEW